MKLKKRSPGKDGDKQQQLNQLSQALARSLGRRFGDVQVSARMADNGKIRMEVSTPC